MMFFVENLDLLMFVALCIFLMAGFPVAFTLGGTALLFAFMGYAFGVFDLTFVAFLKERIFGTMINQVLIAVPLFVFMGTMLERSKVAEELLETMAALFGKGLVVLGYLSFWWALCWPPPQVLSGPQWLRWGYYLCLACYVMVIHLH